MAEDGQAAGLAPGADATIAELMDPVTLEARLKDARARRAEALARRGSESSSESAASQRGPTVALTPKPPAWLHDDTAEDEAAMQGAVQAEARGPTTRVRPVLLASTGGPARTMPAPPPDTAAPPAARPLAATPVPERARGNRLPPAALLFVAGLAVGAAAVAFALRPSREAPAPAVSVATNSASSTPEASTPEAPAVETSATESGAPDAGDPPVAVAALPAAELPAAGDPAGASERPAAIPEQPAPARLAAPVSEPAPPPVASPGPAIGALIDAAAPPPRPAAGASAAASDTPPVTGSAGATLPQSVTIHYPRSAQGLATTVAEQLRAAGVTAVTSVPVGFAIGRSNVRFYHDADRPAAESTGALLAGALDGAPETRDFTSYPTPTVSGRVEIWLAGEPARTAARASKPAQTPTATDGETDPYALLKPGEQVREVQRILLDRLQGKAP
ncbi:MAG: hypothetical protein QM699_18365 [Amaricoccus sp.]|uniref:hypothetical protein n=1 Tax=Amaricoccus sp. TaxID=1872485 RepID=UPI0039E72243